MAIVANKRSIMTLYSGSNDIYSHRARIVLAEKGVSVEIINVDAADNNKVEDLLELNPYGTYPTLIDRDLVLYHANIVMEYLDERFPHPPLMPVYPVARAKTRLMTHRVDKDLGGLIKRIEGSDFDDSEKARNELRALIIKLAPVFNNSTYFLNEDFSLVDCCLAPILWRLPSWGIRLPAKEAKAVIRYADTVFARDSFQASLTEIEQELIKDSLTEI